MATTLPTTDKRHGNRFDDDERRADGVTDKEAGVPAADFRKGTGKTDTDEWKENDTDQVIDEQSVFDDEVNLDESDVNVEEEAEKAKKGRKNSGSF